jgi:hypothetical protein
LQTATRQELLDYFDNTWTLTEVLFSGLQVINTLTQCKLAAFSNMIVA